MAFEKIVLDVVKTVTSTPAYFAYGTLFLGTVDSRTAVKVFNALCNEITPAISFGKVNEFETSYDFL